MLVGWEGAHYNSLGDEVFGLVAIAVVSLDFVPPSISSFSKIKFLSTHLKSIFP